MAKDHIEIPLIYPVIKVNFSTTVFQNGVATLKECEEVLDLKRLREKTRAIIYGSCLGSLLNMWRSQNHPADSPS
jgi:hypothetical protein